MSGSRSMSTWTSIGQPPQELLKALPHASPTIGRRDLIELHSSCQSLLGSNRVQSIGYSTVTTGFRPQLLNMAVRPQSYSLL